MHIKSVTLKNFTVHKDSTITLPASGIVLITGDNGSGKSTVIEGVATALWGKTLRGEPSWVKGQKSSVDVKTDIVRVTRHKDKTKSPKMDWMEREGDTDNYATVSKGQEALDKLIGSFTTWSKTSVFSAQDATHFTLATDKERKQLIEGLVYSVDFDAAVKACRDDLRTAKNDLYTAQREIENLQEGIDAADEMCEELTNDITQLEASPSIKIDTSKLNKLEKNKEKVKARIKQVDKEYETMEDERVEARVAIKNAKREMATAEKEVERLDHDKCPTCDQKIPKKLKDKLQSTFDDKVVKVQEVVAETEHIMGEEMKEEMRETNEYIEELRAKEIKIEKQLTELRTQAGRTEEDKRSIDKKQKRLAAKLADLKNKEEKLKRTEKEISQLEMEVKELKATEKVLGTEGVRAHIINNVLKGIEAIANSWLAKISRQKFYIELKPYSELKKGGVKDKISIKVHGVGGGFGYKGTSAGERRRIDTALVFALAEIAAGAQGTSPGTLFIDEVADGLDAFGRSAIAEVLNELSKERCVVVISHDEVLAQALQPQKHLHVDNGVISERG